MDAEHLAEKIIASALELDARRQDIGGPSPITINVLLDNRSLGSELQAWSPSTEPETLIVLLAISAARDVLSIWTTACPTLLGPARAISCAEQWIASRTEAAALAASSAAEQASIDAQSVWNTSRLVGWAGRTASWAAMAPRYRWAAVASLIGAVRAATRDVVARGLVETLMEHHG